MIRLNNTTNKYLKQLHIQVHNHYSCHLLTHINLTVMFHVVTLMQ